MLISAHTFAYISLDAMIQQEADKTHIEYGFPVVVLEPGYFTRGSVVREHISRFKVPWDFLEDNKPPC